jgi:hypothetical protein
MEHSESNKVVSEWGPGNGEGRARSRPAPRGFPDLTLPAPKFEVPVRNVDVEGCVFALASCAVIVSFLTSFALLEGGRHTGLGAGLGAGSVVTLFFMARWALHRL